MSNFEYGKDGNEKISEENIYKMCMEEIISEKH